MKRFSELVAIAAVALAFVSGAQAVDIQTVTVGNPGNADDTHGDGYGGVDYEYRIGTFKVTAGQYTEFLNAVADEDTYGLYNSEMNSSEYGCQITQDCTGGSCTYDFSGRPSGSEADWADRPVNYVSWGDVARFANWLHNEQLGLDAPVPQDEFSTEDGSYYLNGATSDEALLAVTRQPDATWVIPSEDEWYKAAYHYNDGVTANYYDYPTSSDTVPTCDCCPPAGPNSANYDCNGAAPDGLACGPPYYRTNVGCYVSSPSPYVTFDQGGNVYEWNEAVIGSYRGLRGGSYNNGYDHLHAAIRVSHFSVPTYELSHSGFRVAEVSEPGPDIPTVSEWGVVTMALLVLTAGTLIYARRGAAIA